MTGRRAAYENVGVSATVHVPGVSRFDLICSARVQEAGDQHVRRWAQDRALPTRAIDRLSLLTWAALGHGLRHGPRAVTVILRWVDLDRVRVDVQWHGPTRAARSSVSSQQVEASIALFDAVAETWGFGHGSPGSQWMILDTRA